jgi:hypothetical protein
MIFTVVEYFIAIGSHPRRISPALSASVRGFRERAENNDRRSLGRLSGSIQFGTSNSLQL